MATLRDAYALLHEGSLALAEVERTGIRVDVDYCRAKGAWVDEQLRRADRRLRDSALGRAWVERFEGRANFGSGLQLQAVLYASLGVKPFKTTDKGLDSVDEESLLQVEVDGIRHLLRQRSLKKVSDTLRQFLRYQVDGRLYPDFHLHTVTTFRSSSANPNLQNVPHRDKEQTAICRRAIVPSSGNQLLEIDYAGIEVAVSACYHKDPAMLAYLNDPKSDMHADAAKRLFFLNGDIAELKKREGFSSTLRQAAKGFVFSQFYGDYYEHCAPNIACGWCKLPRLGDWTDADGIMFDGRPIGWHLRRQKFKVLDERGLAKMPAPTYDYVHNLTDFTQHVRSVERWLWDERFPVYARWKKDWYNRYQKRGSFAMKTGFTCSGVMSRNQSVNYPVQGSAFHLLLQTLIWVVQRTSGWRSKVVGEVHDSLLIDAAPEEVSALVAMVRGIVADELPKLWDWIVVPLRVEAVVSDVDGSWSQMRVVE